MSASYAVHPKATNTSRRTLWVAAFAVAVLCLLAWIGWSLQVQRSQQMAAAAQSKTERAYYNCLENAKHPSLCMKP